MILTQGVYGLPRRIHRRVCALLDRLEMWDTPALTALVLGLLALIRSSVTAQRRWRRTFCLAPRLPKEIRHQERETSSFVGSVGSRRVILGFTETSKSENDFNRGDTNL